MSDARLRALERRFRETGAVADEAAWLSERARVGGLAPERLTVAARCGHPAACIAAGLAAPSALTSFEELDAWLEPLADLGQEVVVRTLAAMARRDAGLRIAKPYPNEIPEALHFVEGWLASGQVPPVDYPLCSPAMTPEWILESLRRPRDPAYWTRALQGVARELFLATPGEVQGLIQAELLAWALD